LANVTVYEKSKGRGGRFWPFVGGRRKVAHKEGKGVVKGEKMEDE